ncbi:MarR family winged helix-turn-helix transcriptional regulator [Lapillicoccus sp.]|uniref:MarR family winged helix-turn-helix transcriptional regulator n=1 Tax=Lapillicoccus sp. TaxID=1909287 RepID=UPI0025D25F03|nr:MarR family winged helix-turn-helix transcriptional regulator [Lapillicoccus sp.]
MATRTLQEVGLGIKRAQHRHHRALDSRLSVLGLSLVQWDALRHLAAHPDASLHDLAQLTFQSDQACGTLASRMVDRGLIERLDGPGRAVRHRVTPRGRRLLDQGAAVADAVFAESFGGLSARQIAALASLLDKVNAHPLT